MMTGGDFKGNYTFHAYLHVGVLNITGNAQATIITKRK